MEEKEIVINTCHGGFGLSHEAVMEYAKLKKMTLYVEGEPDDMMINYYRVPIDKYKKYQEKWLKEDGDHRRINKKDWYLSVYDIDRGDKDLIKVIKKLKSKANGQCADLKIIKIPSDIKYEIEEYDGNEWVAEKHKIWS